MKQIKYLVLVAIVLLVGGRSYAQKVSLAPNFGMTDKFGESQFLYEDVLDQGKTAILVIFSIGCESCAYAVPYANEWYQDFGYNEENVVVWGIEIAEFSTYEEVEAFPDNIDPDMEHPEYPLWNLNEQDSVVDLLGISYTPFYFVICPDGAYRSYSSGDVPLAANACLEMVSVDEMEIKQPELRYFNGVINLLNADSETFNLSIYSVDGREVFQSGINTDMPKSLSLKQGIYIYQLKSEMNGKIYTGKFYSSSL